MMNFRVTKLGQIKEIIPMAMKLREVRKKRRKRNDHLLNKIFLVMDAELIKYYVRGPEILTEMADTYILVHGNRSSAIYWDPVVEALHQHRPGVRTVTMDLRGYGQSNHLIPAEKIEDFADDVHKVVLTIANKEGRPKEMIAARFIIVGWSFGGMVVMTLAARYPDFYNRLVLVASGPINGMNFGNASTKEEFLTLPYIKLAGDAIQ